MERENKVQYRVVDILKETANISTLILDNAEFGIPSYKAGQYITVYFPDTNAFQGKAYTISSAPSEKKFSITVKAMGNFSNRLYEMKRGDAITASLPYGYFYSESSDTPLVMVAAGIGITPFRSMIIDAAAQNPSRKLVLFYSNRTIADIAFKKELDELVASRLQCKVHHFITREQVTLPEVTYARIDGKRIVDVFSDKAAEFFICGSIGFTRDIWRGLRARGISEEVLYTEAFFSH